MTEDDIWATLFGLLLVTMLGCILSLILLNPPLGITGWLSDHIPERVQPENIHLLGLRPPRSWLSNAPRWAAIIGLLFLFKYLMSRVSWLWRSGFRASSNLALAVVGALCMYFSLLAFIAVLGAAISVVLLQVGWASAQPQIQSGHEYLTTLQEFAWHTADALPSLSVPSLFNWTLRYSFVDPWSHILVLTYKIIFFAVLTIPVARMINEYIDQRRAPSPGIAILPAAEEFSKKLQAVESTLDETEKLVLETREWRGHHPKELGLGSLGRWSVVEASKRNAQAEIWECESLLGPLSVLFGDSEVFEKAGEAVIAHIRRFKTIERAVRPEWPGKPRFSNPAFKDLMSPLSPKITANVKKPDKDLLAALRQSIAAKADPNPDYAVTLLKKARADAVSKAAEFEAAAIAAFPKFDLPRGPTPA